jgi:hypothetical protein
LNALHDYAKSPLFNAAERVALEYADAMTDTARDVDDALFARVREHYDEEQIAELTMLIAWENASSRFNRALRARPRGSGSPPDAGHRVCCLPPEGNMRCWAAPNASVWQICFVAETAVIRGGRRWAARQPREIRRP